MKLFLDSRLLIKYAFMAIAIVIAVASLVFSNRLVKELAKEERNKIEIWAAATELLAKSDENTDMNLVLQILQSNKTIPVILYDKTSETVTANNIKLPAKDVHGFLLKKTDEFARKHDPIPLEEFNQYVYYDDSFILKRLQAYPYVQLLAISIFIALAFFALMSSQKAQQNKVWAGLSKETAHQLGTPISSLIAWMEYLRLKEIDPALMDEMGKDVHRLEVIAERFSKIGSASDIKPVAWQEAVRQSVAYLEKRISDKVELVFDFPRSPAIILLNESLFSWVIENLTKNAVDAMSGQGVITYSMGEKGKYYFLDITDTGKGLAKSKFNTIFMPGFTTKERGWGLGLSLVKRIVETYHGGKIFVKQSEIGKGSTFRILLRKG
ncbi:MAG TPA: HAMP domain-containing histidine kinase [Petrimonas sp.]|uniref:sensor histidine kinase n=2 Tax=Petrimonas sp. TaxID=2023866 RepID=UPI00096662E1|nr:HAMP domain-containing sensor histidine kinase [Petrimonas sp.]MEA4980468.1 HAMP domain-containing sensor histidine kinase [Petrimonas sp.]MEA5063105.1 HAMP domain-containing sensor histidine kinase [Petrimonas sp.]OJV38125.1 MAG: ATP-binding protein [Bacteroidia bacterium 43-41]HHV86925.1 HAMP domain-containing histidine kinase [Petrimonas sp.]